MGNTLDGINLAAVDRWETSHYLVSIIQGDEGVLPYMVGSHSSSPILYIATLGVTHPYFW